ncbi:hypothetical protein ACTFIW_013012 [Dictyostelium discoideum]
MSPIENINNNNFISKDFNFQIIKNEFSFHYDKIILIYKLINNEEISNKEYIKNIINYYEKDNSCTNSLIYNYISIISNDIESCFTNWRNSLKNEFQIINKYCLELNILNEKFENVCQLEIKLLNSISRQLQQQQQPPFEFTKNEYIILKSEIFKMVKIILEKRNLNFDEPLKNIQISLPILYENLKLIHLDSHKLINKEKQQNKNENENENGNISLHNQYINSLSPDNSFLKIKQLDGASSLSSAIFKPLPPLPQPKQLPSIPISQITSPQKEEEQQQQLKKLRPAPIPKELENNYVISVTPTSSQVTNNFSNQNV